MAQPGKRPASRRSSSTVPTEPTAEVVEVHRTNRSLPQSWSSVCTQPSVTRFHIGIDLAWAEKARKKTNESDIVMLDSAGNVAVADWTVGVDETVGWLDRHAPPEILFFVDAPLVVNNETGQRRCETQVGRR